MSRNDALIEAFAAELKTRRQALGLSQEELAFRAEVNRTYIAKLELAQNQPTLTILDKVAVALGSDLPDFLKTILQRQRKILKGQLKRPARA
jgi:transcriptional regulator with XRE-family HTH domain